MGVTVCAVDNGVRKLWDGQTNLACLNWLQYSTSPQSILTLYTSQTCLTFDNILKNG